MFAARTIFSGFGFMVMARFPGLTDDFYPFLGSLTLSLCF